MRVAHNQIYQAVCHEEDGGSSWGPIDQMFGLRKGEGEGEGKSEG